MTIGTKWDWGHKYERIKNEDRKRFLAVILMIVIQVSSVILDYFGFISVIFTLIIIWSACLGMLFFNFVIHGRIIDIIWER